MKFSKKNADLIARRSSNLKALERYRFAVREEFLDSDLQRGKSEHSRLFYFSEEAELYRSMISHADTLQRVSELDSLSPFVTYGETNDIKGRLSVNGKYCDESIRQLVRDLSIPFSDAKKYFRNHTVHPHEECYQKVFSKVDAYYLKECLERGTADQKMAAVGILDQLVRELREELNSPEVKGVLKKYRRNSQKCLKQLLEMIDEMFAEFSRVLSIRIDFGYQPARLDGSDVFTSLSVAEAVKHRESMLRYVQKQFGPGFIRHAWAMESARLKGIHFHCWFFFDGRKHQSDIKIAKGLGEHWVTKISEGTGNYHNCNLNKSSYPRDAIGIGMLRRGVLEHMEGVRLIAAYLTKFDFFLRYDQIGVRTFGRSIVKRPVG